MSLWKDLLDLIFPPGLECPFCGGQRLGANVCGQCRAVIDGYSQELYCGRCGRYAGKVRFFQQSPATSYGSMT